MYIGKVADLTGCTPKAIRLYESLGLLNAPSRQGRYRFYDTHHVTIIRMIRAAQAAGFKLVEMAPLLKEKERQQVFPLELANQVIAAKRQQVQADIAALKALDERLAGLHTEVNLVFAEPTSQAFSH
ncbi:MerR family transcriptional regulator [Pseudomonas sp. EA_35y_Pfl2_R5]|uniref:MerR family transcriptional regulator n=1 Tax=Pseudomonas sp. EA_35y_Pfl2_R5 TaxID=3088690 RepID=UPI0030D76E79